VEEEKYLKETLKPLMSLSFHFAAVSVRNPWKIWDLSATKEYEDSRKNVRE
jgi:hypothetical protein